MRNFFWTNTTSDFGSAEGHFYRWGGCASHGQWFAYLSFPSEGHVHLRCVVDDFGTLIPVDIAAMLGTGRIINYGNEP